MIREIRGLFNTYSFLGLSNEKFEKLVNSLFLEISSSQETNVVGVSSVDRLKIFILL